MKQPSEIHRLIDRLPCRACESSSDETKEDEEIEENLPTSLKFKTMNRQKEELLDGTRSKWMNRQRENKNSH